MRDGRNTKVTDKQENIYVQRRLEELNLINNFLFTEAASYGEDGRKLCQMILEIILERKLPNLREIGRAHV